MLKQQASLSPVALISFAASAILAASFGMAVAGLMAPTTPSTAHAQASIETANQ